MPNWKAHLGFEHKGKVFPAKFDFDLDPKATSTVRVLVFGEPFRNAFPPHQWRMSLKFNEATGECMSSGYVGRIINVDTDMLAGLDLETGQARKYTLEEAAAILGHAPTAKQRIILDVEPGKVAVVSVTQAGP